MLFFNFGAMLIFMILSSNMLQRARVLLVLLPFLLLTVGCGHPRPTANQPQPEEDGPPLISKNFSIQADAGGTVPMDLGDGSRVKIIFPQDSLQSDATLSVAPRLAQGDDLLSGGFSLTEADSDQGPALKYPAIIMLYADKDFGQDVSIVRYQADGSYEVIPTKVTVSNGQTALMAQVDHFSDYGAKKITPAEREAAERNQQPQDFNWVIYVNDSEDVDLPPMKRKVFLDFKAVNTSGYVFGEYKGYAHAKTTNDMEAMGGRIDADFSVNDENVAFTLDPYIQLAPLVPEGEEDLPLAPLVEDGDEDLPLAKLEPAQEPDFAANGVLNMRGGGSGTVTAGGYSVSRGLEATQSTDSFYLVVVGPMVRLTVNVAGTPTMYFDGYIRGEGK